MQGELALAFGELLRKLWSSGRTAIAPRAFKGKLARFAPQFIGYNQHDSQVCTVDVLLLHFISGKLLIEYFHVVFVCYYFFVMHVQQVGGRQHKKLENDLSVV